MKRLAADTATIAIGFVVLVSMAPQFSAYGRVSRVFHLFGWLLLLAVIATVLVFWVATLVEVLRTGPGTQREWWLASLAVVVVLGPIGALAYKLAAPSFARDNNGRCETDAKRRAPIGRDDVGALVPFGVTR